ncbi:MAG: PEP-CTERM sorting domain-containing protein [Phycisphaerae bacterium]
MRGNLKVGVAGVVLAMAAAATGARAGVIAQYTFSSAGDVSTAPSTVTGATADSIVEGAGLATSNGIWHDGVDSAAGGYGSNLVLEAGYSTGTSATPDDAAIASDGGFSFTVHIDPSATVSLTSLDFKAAYGGTSALRGFFITSSLSSDILGEMAFDSTGTQSDTNLTTVQARPNLTQESIDLSGNPLFQNLSGSDVTFHFYLHANHTNRTFDFDDITLNGTSAAAATPEPASLGLLAAGAALLCARRRRR